MISGVRKPVWSAEIADVETIDVSMHAVPCSIHDVMPSSSMSAIMSRRSKSSGGMSSTTANMQKNESWPRKRYMRAEPYRMSRSASYCGRGRAVSGWSGARPPAPHHRASARRARARASGSPAAAAARPGGRQSSRPRTARRSSSRRPST